MEGGKNISLAKDRRIKKLEQAIAAAHADALALAHEQEAFTEELQSANEEVVSSNEELQTVNEELGTSKEETESANEELAITNQELQTRNDLLNESYDYSEAIIATMHSPMVVLDKSLRVKSASKTFYKKFKVNEEETEGVLLYDLGNRQWNIPRLRELLEDILPKNSHFYDFEITHTFPFVGEKIMLLNASRIVHKTNHEELILLAFADVTEVRKHALEKEAAKKKVLEKELETEKKLKEISEEKQKQLQNIFNRSPFTLTFMEGENFVYKYVNEKAAEVLGAPIHEIIGKSLFEILPEIKAQVFKEKLTEVLKTGKPFVGKEVPATYKMGDKLVHAYFDFVYEPFYDITGKITGVVSSAIDVTEKVLARKKIEESESRFRNLVEKATSPICILKGENMVLDVANDSLLNLWAVGKESIGKTLLEVVPELKGQPFIGYLEGVYKTGITYYGNEEPAYFIRKNGERHTGYYNFVYQPYREDDTIITGVMVLATDVTEQVIARKTIEESEKHQAFLLKLSDTLRPLDNPVDIEGAVTKIALDFMGADWCHYATIEEDNLIIQRGASRGDFPSLAGVYPIGGFVLFKDVLNTGIPSIIDDVHTTDILDEELKQLCIQLQNISFINVPVIKNGKPVGLLSLVQSKPRKWTDAEVQLTIETAERTWAAVEKAKAQEALRESEEKYRMLFSPPS